MGLKDSDIIIGDKVKIGQMWNRPSGGVSGDIINIYRFKEASIYQSI